MLGLRLREESKREEVLPSEIQQLVNARDEARKAKNWAESDRLRNEIQGRGYKVEDSASGTKATKL